MKVHYIIAAMAISLVACNKDGGTNIPKDNPPIKPEPAKTTPPDAKFDNLKVETISNDVRARLGATDERDLIIVVKAKGGSIAYGSPGHGFKKADKGEIGAYLADSKKQNKDVTVVNNINVQTLRASPECYWFEDGFGNVFWYFDAGCPF